MRMPAELLAFCLATGCAATGPQAETVPVTSSAPAPSPVRQPFATAMIRDAALPRSGELLMVDIVFPTTGGPHPVVIFSHGAGGTPYLYRELTGHWAAAGFVVISPTHADSRRLLRDQGLEGRELLATILRSAIEPANWRRRVGDVTSIIDALPRLGEMDPRLARRADPRRVGVSGHSYGAFTSMLAACAQPRAPSGEIVNLRDPRPAAFLLLSAQGPGQQGLERTSWTTCDRPMMVVTGTEDQGRPLPNRPAQTWRDKLEPFRLSPPGGKVGWVMQGAAHSSFVASDRAAAGPVGPAAERDAVDPALQVRLFRALAAQTTAWWQAQLMGDPAARDAVAGGALAREGDVTFLYETR